MDRRTFLKLTASACGSLYIPFLPPRKRNDKREWFDPEHSYGNYVQFTDKGLFRDAYKLLSGEVRAYIPWYLRDKIKWFVKKPGGTEDPLFNYWTLAWRYSP